MAIQKKKKPTKKDIVFNIGLLRKELFMLIEKIKLQELVFEKYLEMKKETKKFNTFLQNSITDSIKEKDNGKEKDK